MSRQSRLDALEAANPDPARAGNRCRDCGGLNIADAMNAYHVLERGRDCGMSPEEAERILDVLEEGTPTCELCGARTLHGGLAALEGVPDDPE
jgi:hypothetical protein